MAEQLSAGAGAQWLKCGWEIFKTSAMNWILIMLVFMVLALVAGFVPLFGSLIFMLVMPVFIGSIYRMGAGERPVEIGGLFSLFGDAAKRTPLIVLGIILFGISLLLSFTFGLSIIGSLPEDWFADSAPDPQVFFEAMFSLRNLLLLSVLMLVQLILSFGFFFAVGLVTFQGTAPMDAFKAGVQAAFSNLLPLLVFGTLYVLLSFIAAIPFGLGFFVLLPVTLLGGYCAYRNIFGGGRGTSSGGQLTA